MKLRFIRDTTFTFRDSNDEFNHSRMTIKENTIINILDDETRIYENIPGCEFEKCFHITFSPYEYSQDDVMIEILNKSENDENDVDELRKIECFIYINTEDVEIIF